MTVTASCIGMAMAVAERMIELSSTFIGELETIYGNLE